MTARGEFSRITVMGDGAWGTALALLLHDSGREVTLWGAFPAYLEEMRASRRNRKFLPGVPIPPSLAMTSDPCLACRDLDLLVSVVPAQHLRAVLRDRFRGRVGRDLPVVTATKGLERGGLRRPSEVIREILGDRPVVVLSGPSHAEEVAAGLPATVVAASEDDRLACRVQELLSTERFRVYTSADPIGVELGGALKNVIAVASGICEGLGLGDNARAALLTRGITEMARIGGALGARRETFFGLAGIGDLFTTAVSPFGRNREFGLRVGRGEDPQALLAGSEKVVEGVPTCAVLHDLAARLSVEIPIGEEVYRVVFEGKSPRRAVQDLMLRDLKAEIEEANL